MSTRIEILTDVATILKRMPAWRTLHKAAGEGPFSSAEWISAWFEAWPNHTAQPAFGLAWQDDVLVAGWPLGCSLRKTSKYSPKVQTLHPLCDDKAGFHELLILPGHEDIAPQMIAAYQKALKWSAMDLTPLKQNATSEAVFRAANRDGYVARKRAEIRTVHAEMPTGWDEYLATRSRDFRKSIRSCGNKLAKLDHDHSITFNLEGPGVARVEEAIELSGRCWKARLGTDLESDPALRTFIIALFRHLGPKDMICLHLLKIDGVEAASCFSLYWNNCAFGIITDFDERFSKLSPGRLLISRSMEQAAGIGIVELNFLRATAFGKRFATSESEYMRVKVARRFSMINAWLWLEEALRPIGKAARKKRQLTQRKRAGNKDADTPKKDT